ADDYEELTITAGADTPDEGDREEGGDTGNEIVRNTGACTRTEAEELANMMYKTERYGALKMSLQTIGDPTMRSRTVTLVWGVGL
ncbi:MAG: hypothetical protein GTN69_01900, partial [Armatimonadetes bacterium]|nr:hypothetical protein [Armatimonadota bacterium]